MSKRKIRPDTTNTDNPEWTAKDVAQARPAHELLPGLFSASQSASLLTPRGRPKAEVTKVRVGIRLSPEVIEHFKASGSGWQTRIDAALRQFIAEHPGAH
ncbi:MAG: BrnA antitoxin family protein [Limnohabitans sp.]